MSIVNREFRFSRYLRGKAVIGAVLLLIAAEFFFSTLATEVSSGGKVGACFFLGLILMTTAPGLLLWKRAEDSIHTTAHEIMQISRGIGSLRIPWPLISEIKEVNGLFGQQLRLSDARQSSPLTVDCALQDAASLVQMICAATPHLRSAHSKQRLFHRDTTILFSYLMLPLALGLLLSGAGLEWRTAVILLGGVSLFSGLLFLREIRTVQINEDHLLLIYLWRRRKLQYAELRDIQISVASKILLAPDFFNESATQVVTVTLELNKGRPVQLSCFREGTLVLYDALRVARENSGNQRLE